MKHTAITISKMRYYGLSLVAEKHGRHKSEMLDWILKKAGVPNLTEIQLKQLLKQHHEEEIATLKEVHLV